MTKLVGDAHAGQLRVVLVERQRSAQGAASSYVADEAVQNAVAPRADDQRADRDLAPTFQRGKECSLGVGVGVRTSVVERGHERMRVGVVIANLDGDRALASGGQPSRRVQIRRDVLRNAEAVQAGGGE